jgi:hypothetical protein
VRGFVPPGQAAACPATVLALPACAELLAFGTVPRSLRLMSAPLIDPLPTLVPLTALLAIFSAVTALAFSWREPTEFLPSLKPPANAVPVSATIRAMIPMTIAGEGRAARFLLTSCCICLLRFLPCLRFP